MLGWLSLVVLLVEGGWLLHSLLVLLCFLSGNNFLLLNLVLGFGFGKVLFKLFLLFLGRKLLLIGWGLIRDPTDTTLLSRGAFGGGEGVLTFHLLVVDLFSLLSCLFLSLSNLGLMFLFFTLLLFFFINLFCLLFSFRLCLFHFLVWSSGGSGRYLSGALLFSGIICGLLLICFTLDLCFLRFGVIV